MPSIKGPGFKFAGGNPNFGRIVDAIGHVGAPIDSEAVDVFSNNVMVVKRGVGVAAKET